MSTGTVFTNNRTQNIRIPAELRFPDGVKTVEVRAVGRDLIISPVENTWDSFSLRANQYPMTLWRSELNRPSKRESRLMIKYMLDTNIVIYIIKRRPIEILEKFNANVGRLVISSITLAELMHGAEKASLLSETLEQWKISPLGSTSFITMKKPLFTTAQFVPTWKKGHPHWRQ